VICVAELSRAGAGSVHGHAGYAAAGFGMVPVRLAEVAVDEPAVREAWVGSLSVWNLALLGPVRHLLARDALLCHRPKVCSRSGNGHEAESESPRRERA